MNGLKSRLLRRIEAEGPMSVAAFMAAALYDPTEGYYRTAGAVGRSGDFVTAPEISQVFGELLGLWCADCWQRLGRPRPVKLIELGPGRGTLASDALRAMAVVPSLLEALEIHLVEVNPRLRQEQELALAGHPVAWHDSLVQVSEGPCLLLANEFFDALPLRQFERTPEGWRERLVGLSPDGELAFGLSGPVPQALIGDALADAAIGSVVELSPAAGSLAAAIGRRVAAGPGAALLVDYGYAVPPLKGTLQAVRAHAYSHPLESPGEVDLSALVDFGTLARAAAAAGAEVHGPLEQGALLQGLGIDARGERLAARATPAQAEAIAAACRRLTAPEEMGGLFKALALVPPGFGAPAAFPLN